MNIDLAIIAAFLLGVFLGYLVGAAGKEADHG